MCGIVGVTGNDRSVEILINGLKTLEYRGYDSAGIYVNDQDGHDYLVKRQGRIKNLESALTDDVHGTAGMVIRVGLPTGNRVKRMLTRIFQMTSVSTWSTMV